MRNSVKYKTYKYDPFSTKIKELQHIEYNHAIEDILNEILERISYCDEMMSDKSMSEKSIADANKYREVMSWIASEICVAYIDEHDYQYVQNRNHDYVRRCSRCNHEIKRNE